MTCVTNVRTNGRSNSISRCTFDTQRSVSRHNSIVAIAHKPVHLPPLRRTSSYTRHTDYSTQQQQHIFVVMHFLVLFVWWILHKQRSTHVRRRSALLVAWTTKKVHRSDVNRVVSYYKSSLLSFDLLAALSHLCPLSH